MRQRVVGAALLRGGRVLACRRAAPPQLAGQWEFPGGKVEPGESDRQALARELHEELGVQAEIGGPVGPQVTISDRMVLRVYRARLADRTQPRAVEHDALRWLGPHELDDVAWLAVDRPVVQALRALLTGADAQV